MAPISYAGTRQLLAQEVCRGESFMYFTLWLAQMKGQVIFSFLHGRYSRCGSSSYFHPWRAQHASDPRLKESTGTFDVILSLIFQAHNLEDAAREAASAKLSLSDLGATASEMQRLGSQCMLICDGACAAVCHTPSITRGEIHGATESRRRGRRTRIATLPARYFLRFTIVYRAAFRVLSHGITAVSFAMPGSTDRVHVSS